MADYPQLLQTVLDTTDVRGLATFYRDLFGLRYRSGEEIPADTDWVILRDADGNNRLAFQQVEHLTPTTWPEHDVPMQLHLDFMVTSVEELERHRGRAEALGARLVLDRSGDADEPLYVLADPAGHPFCLFVG